MFSYPPKEAPMIEPLLCPECGKTQMIRVIESCQLEDGFTVKKLRHYKCQTCEARFFDDDAMHRIQTERATREHRVEIASR
jgi:transcriptional regulator NrdR family protein